MKLYKLALLLLFAAPAFGQNYAIAPIPKVSYLDNNGAYTPAALLCSYQAGSTTPQGTFADATGTPNTNPLQFDSNGRANVWINSNAYKFAFFGPYDGTGSNSCNGTPVGTLFWTVDNIRDWGLVAIGTGVGTFTKIIVNNTPTAEIDLQVNGVQVGSLAADTSEIDLCSGAGPCEDGVSIAAGTVHLFSHDNTLVGSFDNLNPSGTVSTQWTINGAAVGVALGTSGYMEYSNGSVNGGLQVLSSGNGIYQGEGATSFTFNTQNATSNSIDFTYNNSTDAGTIKGNSSGLSLCSVTGPCTGGLTVAAGGTAVQVFGSAASVFSFNSAAMTATVVWETGGTNRGNVTANSSQITLCSSTGPCTAGIGPLNAGTGVNVFGTSSGSPGTPAAGIYTLFVDSADSNKLKVVGPSATVTTLAVP